MDWPVIGAVTGVAALAGLVGFGAVALMRSPAPQVKKAPATAVLWMDRKSDVVHNAVPALAPLSVPDWQQSLVTEPPNPSYPDTQVRKKPVVAKPAAEPSFRPAPSPDQKKMALASAPPVPKLQVQPPLLAQPKVDRRYDGVMTPGEISRLKSTLRLSRDQEPHWPAVEMELREIGRQQIAQVNSGRKAEVNSGSVQRLYYAARPLLGMLRPDQKEQIRRLARSLGYDSVASMI